MAEWQQAMSSREFAEWWAYYQLDPFGPERADLRNAALMALIAEMFRDPKKRGNPFTPEDFMPSFDGEERAPRNGGVERPGPEELYQRIRSWAAVAGGKRGVSE